MPKWLWFVLAFLLSSAVYFSIRYGLRPKPIPQLNPTVFENPEQVGVVTYRALRASLRQERLLIIGSNINVPQYAEIWNGFLKAALADRAKIDIVFQREELNSVVVPGANVRPVKLDTLTSKSFLDEVRGSYQKGEMALIHVRNDESTHLIQGTLTRRLQELPSLPVVSISMLPMAVRQEDLERLVPHCVDPRNPDSGEQRLECAASRISRRYLRKRLPADKWVAAIERHGLKEFLLFVSAPQ